MRILLSSIVLIGLLITGATKAADYQSIGSGTSSCCTWTADRRDYNLPGGRVTEGTQRELAESAWVVGFLSGVGFVGANGDGPLDGVDAEGVWAWIDNYCQAHPIENLAKAAAAFYYARPGR